MYTVIIQKSAQAQSRRGPGDRSTAQELGRLYGNVDPALVFWANVALE